MSYLFAVSVIGSSLASRQCDKFAPMGPTESIAALLNSRRDLDNGLLHWVT